MRKRRRTSAGKARRKKVTDQILVGTFQLGYEFVDLIAQTKEKGGCFCFCPDDNASRARINVGVDYENWGSVVTVLIHEVLEFLFLRAERAYRSTGKMINDTGDRLFILNHPEFAECCGRLAHFLVDVLPALHKVYRKL